MLGHIAFHEVNREAFQVNWLQSYVPVCKKYILKGLRHWEVIGQVQTTPESANAATKNVSISIYMGLGSERKTITGCSTCIN